jgi:hypothetical protein
MAKAFGLLPRRLPRLVAAQPALTAKIVNRGFDGPQGPLPCGRDPPRATNRPRAA